MILFCIELYRRRAAAVDVKALEYTYTLEHIMPRKWEKDWSDVPIVDNGTTLLATSPEGMQFRNNAVQSLGNKTLLTTNLNSSVKNACFVKKIQGDGDHKPGYEGLTSLFITKEVIDRSKTDPVWDEAHIFERCTSLFKEFVEIWPSYTSSQPTLVNNEDPDPILSQYTDEQLADASALLSAVPLKATTIENQYAGMLSLDEFKLSVSAQPETIDSYIRDKKIIPDAVNTGITPNVKLFRLSTIKSYAQQFGWTIIDDSNRKSIFLKMVQDMDMSYSYKPVFLKAVLTHCSVDGIADLNQIVLYFLHFYSNRQSSGLFTEKPNSVFAKPDCSFEEAQKVILKYPYDRFRTMQVLSLNEAKTHIQFNPSLWEQLTGEDKEAITSICDEKLAGYYSCS